MLLMILHYSETKQETDGSHGGSKQPLPIDTKDVYVALSAVP